MRFLPPVEITDSIRQFKEIWSKHSVNNINEIFNE